MESQIDLDKLLDMQKQLMDKVPHNLRREVYSDVMCVKHIIEKSLLFLNSLGHKPWRPDPLPPEEQQSRLKALTDTLEVLLKTHNRGYIPTFEGEEYEKWTRQLISTFGVIEESLEYLNSVENKSKSRANRLEEITDVLFFYLEQIILSGFSLKEIEQEYIRKHAVNLERYRRGKEGDYGWDKRHEGEL